MRTKTDTTKKVAKKAAKKANPKNGRDVNGKFIKGNKAALKWTEETIIPELEKVLAVLTHDDSGDQNDNPVRANDIKYAEEAVMCTDVPLTAWDYWNSTDFKATIPKESAVFLLLKQIKTICQYRLSYSGQAMDIFHLKNHYGYKDKVEQEVTTTHKGSVDIKSWLTNHSA